MGLAPRKNSLQPNCLQCRKMPLYKIREMERVQYEGQSLPLLFLHYIEPTASVFYTHNIWLHSHVLKCLLHALSEGKNKNSTPLRQYDVTGFIYGKTFFTIVISAPENPDLPPLIAAQYLISFEFHIRQYLPKFPGTFSKKY